MCYEMPKERQFQRGRALPWPAGFKGRLGMETCAQREQAAKAGGRVRAREQAGPRRPAGWWRHAQGSGFIKGTRKASWLDTERNPTWKCPLHPLFSFLKLQGSLNSVLQDPQCFLEAMVVNLLASPPPLSPALSSQQELLPEA